MGIGNKIGEAAREEAEGLRERVVGLSSELTAFQESYELVVSEREELRGRIDELDCDRDSLLDQLADEQAKVVKLSSALGVIKYALDSLGGK